jgi:hypothetical protein
VLAEWRARGTAADLTYSHAARRRLLHPIVVRLRWWPVHSRSPHRMVARDASRRTGRGIRGSVGWVSDAQLSPLEPLSLDRSVSPVVLGCEARGEVIVGVIPVASRPQPAPGRGSDGPYNTRMSCGAGARRMASTRHSCRSYLQPCREAPSAPSDCCTAHAGGRSTSVHHTEWSHVMLRTHTPGPSWLRRWSVIRSRALWTHCPSTDPYRQ